MVGEKDVEIKVFTHAVNRTAQILMVEGEQISEAESDRTLETGPIRVMGISHGIRSAKINGMHSHTGGGIRRIPTGEIVEGFPQISWRRLIEIFPKMLWRMVLRIV
jgi:hypothetical protein